ncbi:hypothetical protein FGADI_6835 [Fusarium gaditjirri]|uniref:Uncharacterized protein n=1 Tax=Fusarium gaditjirri TaxID=282569 RepID=A0A8H4T6J0_9HYPO|nr:hypothetical protein FGADI_6835 [Fusarium gaditjirri]
MAADSSLVDLHDASMSDDKDDLDSLPSISTDDIYSDTSDTDAQAEWERSLEQLQLILTMMIVPWMGKYFGRKFAYWKLAMPEGDFGVKGRKETTYTVFHRVWGRDAYADGNRANYQRDHDRDPFTQLSRFIMVL